MFKGSEVSYFCGKYCECFWHGCCCCGGDNEKLGGLSLPVNAVSSNTELESTANKMHSPATSSNQFSKDGTSEIEL